MLRHEILKFKSNFKWLRVDKYPSEMFVTLFAKSSKMTHDFVDAAYATWTLVGIYFLLMRFLKNFIKMGILLRHILINKVLKLVTDKGY